MWKHHPGAVIHPNAFWHQLFGRKYPRAKDVSGALQNSPWVAWRTAEPRAADGPDDWAGPDNPRPTIPRPTIRAAARGTPDRDPDETTPGWGGCAAALWAASRPTRSAVQPRVGRTGRQPAAGHLLGLPRQRYRLPTD